MSSPPHLDAGRIYRLAPFEEVVTELRKTFANAPSVLPPQPAPTQRVPAQRVAIGNGRPPVTSTAAGETPFVLLGDDDLPVATFDGAALTARRTPAVSALATDALARDDVRRLAVFGTDVQARQHVRAMRWIRPSLEQIEIAGEEPVATERFVAMLRGEGHPAVVASASDASSADLICLCMSAVLAGLSAGTHVNAVGRLVVATLAARNAGLID